MAHSHTQTGAMKGRYIGLSVVLTLAFVVGETVAGYFAHSLALLSDAGHNFADALALLLSWYAIWVGTKPSDVKRTYGYHRVGILVALVNAVSLVVIALVIFWEAVQRFRLPEPVHSGLMIWVALAAVALNAAITFWLHGEAKEDLIVRSAYLHMLGDAVSALGVVLAGIVVAFTGTQNRSNSSVSGGQAGEVGRAGVLTVGFQAGGERLALEAASHPRMGFRRSLVQIQSPRLIIPHKPFGKMPRGFSAGIPDVFLRIDPVQTEPTLTGVFSDIAANL